MKITQFEELKAWQYARLLCNLVYSSFEEVKDYGLKSQIERASVSVMNNIAEGFERQTQKEFKQFLYIAKGSCGEVRSMLYIAKDLKILNDKEFKEIFDNTISTSKLISGLIKSIK